MSTVVHRAEPDALGDPNRVKVVLDRRGFALYFSRAPIPYRRDAAPTCRSGSTSASTPTGASSCTRYVALAADAARARRGARAAARPRARLPRSARRSSRAGAACRSTCPRTSRRSRRSWPGAPAAERLARPPLRTARRSPRRARCSSSLSGRRRARSSRRSGCAGCARCSARRRPRPRRRSSRSSSARRWAAAAAARFAPRSARPLALYGALELGAAALGPRGPVPARCRRGRAARAATTTRARACRALLAALRFAAALAATLPASLAFGATLPALAAAAVGAPARARAARRRALRRQHPRRRAGHGARLVLAARGARRRAGYACGVGGARRRRRARALGLAPRFAPAPPEPPRRRAPRAAEPARRSRPRGSRALRRPLGLRRLRRGGALHPGFALVLDQSVYAFGARAGGRARRPRPRRPRRRRARSAARRPRPARLLAGGPRRGRARRSPPSRRSSSRRPAASTFLASERPWPGYLAARARHRARRRRGRRCSPRASSSPRRSPRRAGSDGAGGAAAARLGRLAAANTAGALAGALAAPVAAAAGARPLALLRRAGALYAAAASPPRGARRGARDPRSPARCWRAPRRWLVAREPTGACRRSALAAGETLVASEPTPAGLVAVVDRAGELLIQTDNHYALGGSAQAIHEERQAHVRAAAPPGRAARGVDRLRHRHQRRRGAARIRSSGSPWSSSCPAWRAPRAGTSRRGTAASTTTRAARSCSTTAATSCARPAERFDAIVADLFVPWQAGAASLYAREHFAAVRARLAPGGLFCQWLPLYQLGEGELRVVARRPSSTCSRSAALFRGDFYGRFPIVALVGYEGARSDARTRSRRRPRRLARGGRRATAG